MKIEIIDENGNHVCYMDDESKEFKKLKRKEKIKEVASNVAGVGVVVAYVGACAASTYLSYKFIKWLITN